LIVHGVNDVRKTETHTAEPVVSETSALEVHMAVGKLKRHKSQGMEQKPTQLIKARGITTHSEIHKLNNSIWIEEELHAEWKESLIVHIYMKGDKTDCSNCTGILLLSST
jgi:hypothetical protein